MKTLEERVAELEKRVVDLEAIVMGTLTVHSLSLEAQHRLKMAVRAKAKED